MKDIKNYRILFIILALLISMIEGTPFINFPTSDQYLMSTPFEFNATTSIFGSNDSSSVVLTYNNNEFFSSYFFSPSFVGQLDNLLSMEVDVVGDYIYVASFTKLKIYDISNKYEFALVGKADEPGGKIRSIFVRGDFAYVGDRTFGFRIFNVTNKDSPYEVSNFPTSTQQRDIYVDDSNFAYLADGNNGKKILDISDINTPKLVGSLDESGKSKRLYAEGDYLYLCDMTGGFKIINISVKSEPNVVGSLPSIESTDLSKDGNIIYLAAEPIGFYILNVSDVINPQVLSITDQLGNCDMIDSQESYVYLGCGNYFYIYEVSNKSFPILIHNNTVSDIIKGIKVDGNTVFLSLNTHGIASYNITDLNHIYLMGEGEGPVQDIFVVGKYIFCSVGSKGLVIYESSNKDQINWISNYFTNGKINDIFVVEEKQIVYLAEDTNKALTIIGISNIFSPFKISTTYFDYSVKCVIVKDNYAYVGVDGKAPTTGRKLIILDISDPYNPIEKGTFETDPWGSSYSFRGLEISGNFVFISDNGLKILNIENKTNPILVHLYLHSKYSYQLSVFGLQEEILVLGGTEEVLFFDIRNKSEVVLISEISIIGSGILDVHVEGNTLFIATSIHGIRMYDISDPKNPILSDSILEVEDPKRIYVDGNFLYVADSGYGVKIIETKVLIKQNSYFCGNISIEINATDSSSMIVADSFVVIANTSCNNHGLCTDNKCYCYHNYNGSDCKNKCPSCSCPSGYYGELCNITVCDGLLRNESSLFCNGRAYDCWPKEVCHCFDDYFGSKCEISVCFGVLGSSDSSVVCNGNGECIDTNICSCSKNYFGKNCNITTCNSLFSNDSTPRSGHGDCTSYDHCICMDNYYGEFCNLSSCNGIFSNDSEKVCSNHGSCVDFEKCICSEHYFGENCEITSCDSILSNSSESSMLCNGKGNCTSYNLCQCIDHWNGSFCSITYCANISSDNQDEVCAGHGNCFDYDQCQCTDTRYSGQFCSKWTCFGIGLENLTHVCAGHGFCIDRNKCFCNIGYSSSVTFGICDEYYCSNILYSSDKVCSKRGTCIDYNTCICDDDYEGEDCSEWSCGAPWDDPNTCNGHGKCKKPNKCSCDSFYDGKNCENNLVYSTIVAPSLGVFSFLIFGVILFVIICIICCCILGCIFFVCILFGLIVAVQSLSGFVIFQKKRLKRFSRLKNFDILMLEQKLEEDTSVAHIKINKSLFSVNYEEIHLEKVLGEGGSASVVYLASWKRQRIAFKCFKTRNVCGSQNDFEEFEREVSVLSSISHPFIIQFFGACLSPPRIGILMEYCSKGDLYVFLSKFKTNNDGKEYPFFEKIRMSIEISSACEYLHSRSIIHRDIKLENVLVDGSENCKLMDFGLSKIVDRMSQVKTRKIGTNIYMPPEVASGGHYDEKCDVYSFAIMLFIMMSENFFPYGKASNVEMRVSMDEQFRPKLEEIEEKSFFVVVVDDDDEDDDDSDTSSLRIERDCKEILKDIISTCWVDKSANRYSFKKIIMFLEKIYENRSFIEEKESRVVTENKNYELKVDKRNSKEEEDGDETTSSSSNEEKEEKEEEEDSSNRDENSSSSSEEIRSSVEEEEEEEVVVDDEEKKKMRLRLRKKDLEIKRLKEIIKRMEKKMKKEK